MYELVRTCPLQPAGSAPGGKRLAKAERLGLEPRRHLRVDRLAICSVTTPAPLLKFYMNVHSKMRMQM